MPRPRLKRGPGPAQPARPTQAPVYHIAPREITAVEHPMIIQNLENGLNTFGRNRPFQRIMNSVDAEECVPLYLRQNDPMITVPKRTGRKRKRGSQIPYEESNAPDHALIPEHDTGPPPTQVNSFSRLDEPSQILRKLKDNVGKYAVEAVGEIRQTHRYRGMSDFHQSSSNAEFVTKLTNTLLTSKIEHIREFKLDERRGWVPNEDIVPPPIMSSHALPFNWGWHQAVHLTQEQDESGKRILVNHSKPERGGVQYLVHEVKDIPFGPDRDEPSDEYTLALIDTLKQAMEERPIWTRRSLLNRVGNVPGIYQFKQAIPFVGYQFKGGPWRDALIKFGVDPRKDPKYRKYQTFFFQFNEESEKFEGEPWRDTRPNFTISKKHGITHTNDDTHVFDGKKLTLDGKIWQVCDITVPLLVNLMEDAPYRDQCEILTDGWYCNGTIAKFKAIMKTKLIAVKAKRELADSEFEAALAIPDIVPERLSRLIPVPLPDLGLTQDQLDEMEKKGILNNAEATTIQRWVRNKKSYKARAERIRGRTSDHPKRVVKKKKSKGKEPANVEKGDTSVNAGAGTGLNDASATAQIDVTGTNASAGDAGQLTEESAAEPPHKGQTADDTKDEMGAGIDGSIGDAMGDTPGDYATPLMDIGEGTTPGMVESSPGMIASDDDGMDSEEERDALASDIDDDEEDYFSDAVEHQAGLDRVGGDEDEEEDENED